MCPIIIGLQSLLQYANGCLEFNNYYECIEVCDTIVNKEDQGYSDIMLQAKLTKGKATFFSYKRKFHQIFMNIDIRETKEGKQILKECYLSMNKAIYLLGNSLDNNTLDEEGSKLLDWAMIDCISTQNKLNECKRCLLCRNGKIEKMQRSHIWPKSIIDSSSSMIFGLHKHKVTSPGNCTYFMLCQICEQLLSQNGESNFKAKFPTSGEITYSSWLFSFCAGLIFRTLSVVCHFPMYFNDGEIHEVLLHCRKHLLSLPVKSGENADPLGDYNKRELKFARQLKDNLDIYLFMSPLKSCLDYGTFTAQYKTKAISLSRSQQMNDRSLNFNGYVHFLLLCSGPITLIVNFDQSDLSLKNRGFHLTSNPTDSDKKYSIPSEEDCVKLLPVGVWPIMEELAKTNLEDLNEVIRHMPEKSKVKLKKTPPLSTVCIRKSETKTMFPIFFLPKEYNLIIPYLKLPHGQCFILPQGCRVICHATRNNISSVNTDLTFLVCVTLSEQLHVIFLSQDYKNHTVYTDGVVANFENGKIKLTTFLQENVITKKNEDRLSMHTISAAST